MTKNILCIGTFSSRSEAEVAKSALAAEGIDSFIEADDAGGMYPTPLSPSGVGVKIFVKVEDEKKAKTILNI